VVRGDSPLMTSQCYTGVIASPKCLRIWETTHAFAGYSHTCCILFSQFILMISDLKISHLYILSERIFLSPLFFFILSFALCGLFFKFSLCFKVTLHFFYCSTKGKLIYMINFNSVIFISI
jgi:hypothetical protein